MMLFGDIMLVVRLVLFLSIFIVCMFFSVSCCLLVMGRLLNWYLVVVFSVKLWMVMFW